MPYVSHRTSRKHESIRRVKRRIKRGILFIGVILAATYALNFFFNLSQYVPNLNSPTANDQELILRKLEEASKKSNEFPKAPPRPVQVPKR